MANIGCFVYVTHDAAAVGPTLCNRQSQIWGLKLCCAVYTGSFTTLGHNCRKWYPRSLWWKKFL